MPMLLWDKILFGLLDTLRLTSSTEFVVAILMDASAQALGLFSAATLRWRVSKRTPLEMKPHALIVTFVVLTHVALVGVILFS